MSANKLKVLFIDDDLECLDVAASTISAELPAAAVYVAGSGQEGLALALREDPDVILLDISMPGMDGFEVCRRIKADARLKNIPVVFATAKQTVKENLRKALEEGVEGFLAKPFKAEELAAQVLSMAKIKAASMAAELAKGRLETLVAERTVELKRELAERKQLDEALRESEERYRLFINSTADLVFLKDEALRYILVNNAMTSFYGRSTGQIIGRTDAELMSAGAAEGCLASDRKAIRDNSVVISEESFGGQWFETTKFPVPLPAGKTGVGGFIRDISERKKSEIMLSDIIEKNPMSIQILDKAGLTLKVNPAHTSLFGSVPPQDFSIFDDLQRKNPEFGEILRRVRNGEAVSLPDIFYNPHDLYPGLPDSPVWIHATLFQLNNGENQGKFVFMHEEVTARRKVEEELRESRQLLDGIISSLPVRVFWKDKNLVYLGCNAAFARDAGAAGAKDIIGKDDRQLVWRDQADAYRVDDRQVIESGRPKVLIEEEQTTPGGDIISLLTSKIPLRGPGGDGIGVLGVYLDITERKRAEAALLEAFEMQGALNAMLQRSLANTPLREKLNGHLAALFALPWLAVQPKGSVFLMNARGNALALAAQRGLPAVLVEACANVPLGRCLCGRAAESGQVVESAEIGHVHDISYEGMPPHGHYCAPIRAGGRTLGVLNLYLEEKKPLTDSQRRFVGSATDIMAENILHAQTEEKLAQSQRMESVGRLAGGVAHDFNNILTAIKCYAEFVHKGLDPQDPKQDDVREILTAADRAVALTRQMLAFSRHQILAPKAVDLNSCVAGVTNMLRRLIGEDIMLSTKLAPVPCVALLDTGQVEQVLVNLVVNARDAMPGGGAITLSTELLPQSMALSLAHADLPPGPLVCLTVGDAGTGMTEEVKSHLFEPFFTTKERGKGTGLGLPTVFGIVKQSGGDIEVESESGKGTVFRIFFPYYDPVSGREDKNKVKNAAGAAKGLETIMLVEDEESLRRLGKRVLESGGYNVMTAAGGPEALKLLEQYGKTVDLLVTDVVMPGMSGRELGRELARRKITARTIYMSGYTDDAIVKHGVLEPGLAFIYKPFTADGLLLKVRSVLDAPPDQARA